MCTTRPRPPVSAAGGGAFRGGVPPWSRRGCAAPGARVATGPAASRWIGARGSWWPGPPTSTPGSSPGRAVARSTLHDHGDSAGAVSVIDGTLVEAVPWREDSGRLVVAAQRVPRPGRRSASAPGHVHDVTNESAGTRAQPARLQPDAVSMTSLRSRPATGSWPGACAGRHDAARPSSPAHVASTAVLGRAHGEQPYRRRAPGVGTRPDRPGRAHRARDGCAAGASSWSTSAPSASGPTKASSGSVSSSSATCSSGASICRAAMPCPRSRDYDQQVVVVCSEGYASSLAAASAPPARLLPGRRPRRRATGPGTRWTDGSAAAPPPSYVDGGHGRRV